MFSSLDHIWKASPPKCIPLHLSPLIYLLPFLSLSPLFLSRSLSLAGVFDIEGGEREGEGEIGRERERILMLLDEWHVVNTTPESCVTSMGVCVSTLCYGWRQCFYMMLYFYASSFFLWANYVNLVQTNVLYILFCHLYTKADHFLLSGMETRHDLIGCQVSDMLGFVKLQPVPVQWQSLSHTVWVCLL